jgi:hypothetical protein
MLLSLELCSNLQVSDFTTSSFQDLALNSSLSSLGFEAYSFSSFKAKAHIFEPKVMLQPASLKPWTLKL